MFEDCAYNDMLFNFHKSHIQEILKTVANLCFNQPLRWWRLNFKTNVDILLRK